MGIEQISEDMWIMRMIKIMMEAVISTLGEVIFYVTLSAMLSAGCNILHQDVTFHASCLTFSFFDVNFIC